MKKGFTLVELLAVIVILAIILAIAVPTISSLIENSRVEAYKNQKGLLKKSATTYLASNANLYPSSAGESIFIRLSDLINNNYMSAVLDPKDKSTCNSLTSGVTVTNVGLQNYSYEPILQCANYKTDTDNPEVDLTVNGNTLKVEAYDLNNLSFNGSNQYIQLPQIGNVRSMEFKMKPINGGYIYDARPGLTNGWFYSGGPGANWIKMYVDGVTIPIVYANVPKNKLSYLYFESNINFSDNINIFSRYSNNECHSGKIFEVRIWDRVLTNEEVNNNKISIQNTTGLLAHYKFNDGSGNVLMDYSGNNNHGTLVNNPTWNTNSGIKEIRIKQGTTVIATSNQSTYTFTLASGSYTVEVEDNAGNISTKAVAI